jgi:Tol biopolymer transport system component
MRLRFIVSVLIVVVVAALVPAPNVGLAQDAYEQLVRRALSDLGTNCANLARNSACYGFPEAQATFKDTTSPGVFSQPGDRVALTNVASLTTSAFNLGTSSWGVVVMNVQANVPSALDHSAVFTLLGDVEFEDAVLASDAFVPVDPVAVTTSGQAELRGAPASDAYIVGTVAGGTVLQADGISPDSEWLRVMYEEKAAWVSLGALTSGTATAGLPVITAHSRSPMQAFNFHTGGNQPPSLAVPPNVVIVQAPENTPVDIFANGAHIRVEGVIFLRTLPDGRTQILTDDGTATLFPDAPNRVVVVAGTSVIFGGGTWSDWRILSQAEWDVYVNVKWIPGNVLIIEITIPTVISASGTGGVVITIIVRLGIFVPYPWRTPTFPRIPIEYGTRGSELERLAWDPFSIGCGACLPKNVFYHSDAENEWNIYKLIDAGTSGPPNNVSRGPAGSDNIQPSYSADGQWVAFSTNRDILGGWEVYLAKADGSKQVRLTYNSANDINPVWGPANQIAWESNRDGNWELYMSDVSTDGMPVRLTDDTANDINPFWLPDGGCNQPGDGRLVFQSDRDGDWEIYMLDVTTRELTKLTDNDTEDQVPVLTADGTKLAWVQLNQFGVYDLWVMDLATKEARQVTDVGADVAGQVFSPDGSFLTFYANLDGDYDLFAVDLATDAIKPLTVNNAEDRAPSFLCDNSRIVYHSDVAADEQHPDLRQVFELNPLPLNGPANAPTRLTEDATADDIYPVSDPHKEIGSKEARVPAHP